MMMISVRNIRAKSYKKSPHEMLMGIKPSLCSKCYQREEVGLLSQRNHANIFWGDVLKKILNGEIQKPNSEHIRSFDVRMNNICNMACRTCGKENSSKWGTIMNKVDNRSDPVVIGWSNAKNMGKILKYRSSLNDLYFAGGEPFATDDHLELLKCLIDGGESKNIRIRYNTNVSILPKEIPEIWRQFKEVIVGASVDAVGPLAEHVRAGTRWEQIDKNINLLDGLREEGVISDYFVSVTVSLLNIFGLVDLIQYCDRHKTIYKLKPLVSPNYFSITNLPMELKAVVNKELSPYSNFEIDGLLKFMMLSEFDSDLWSQFEFNVKRHDLIFGQHFLDVAPVYAGYIKGY